MEQPGTTWRIAANRDLSIGALLVVLAAAVAIRVAVFASLAGGPLHHMHSWTESDMHFFRSWAGGIAEGDILSRDTGRPAHSWHDNFAREVHERFEGAGPYGPDVRRRLWDRWLGGARFYQDPLYPYLLAVSLKLSGDGALPVIIIQTAAGAASAALVWMIGCLLFDARAGLISGLMAALYGPLLLYEGLLLRTSAITFLILSLLAAGVLALRFPFRMRWHFAAGALAGISVLLKSSALLIFGALVLLVLHAGRRKPRATLARAAILLAGFMLALSPLVARNAAVGVPPFSVAASGPVTFINHNAAGYDPMGGDSTSELAPGILHRTDGRLLPSVIETVRTHQSFGDWLGLLFRKLLSFWHRWEIPNNASYDYFRVMAGPIALLFIGFPLVAPLAVVGAAATSLRSHAHALLLASLLTGIALTLAFYNLSRFRTPIAMAMIPFAGWAVSAGISAIRRRDWRPLALGAAVAALMAAVVCRPMPGGRPAIRTADYGVANEIALHLAESAEASGEIAAGLALLERQLRAEPESLRAAAEGDRAVELSLQDALLAGSFSPLHGAASRLSGRLGRDEEARAHARAAGILGGIRIQPRKSLSDP
jgi:4-amino-4-deoxy-L-arabinose transferase-like glycosyltransferase